MPDTTFSPRLPLDPRTRLEEADAEGDRTAAAEARTAIKAHPAAKVNSPELFNALSAAGSVHFGIEADTSSNRASS